MSDIHQEWRELREKNGNFINHLDGEVAKIEKKQVELKHREQLQNLADAGAFAMQFAVPFNCCQDDRDILKDLNKAQADRIETLEKELIARKEQAQIDLAVKKDLDEKLDKAAADYKALCVEKENLKERVVNSDYVNAVLSQRNDELREMANGLQVEIHNQNAVLATLRRENDILKHAVPSCNTYAQQGMQSKIAKQANEIKRLTDENKCLRRTCGDVSLEYTDLARQFKTSKEENKQLHKALDIAAKDADANFERGKIKGMQEIWKELVDCYDGRPIGENQKIFGCHTVGDMLMNLSPTWFMNRAMEYHEQKEKEDRDIQIGDEVEIFDSHDHSLSDTGVVIAIDFVMDENLLHFTVIGPKFEGCFDETDIDAGNVRKTGQHFDSIPLDYLA